MFNNNKIIFYRLAGEMYRQFRYISVVNEYILLYFNNVPNRIPHWSLLAIILYIVLKSQRLKIRRFQLGRLIYSHTTFVSVFIMNPSSIHGLCSVISTLSANIVIIKTNYLLITFHRTNDQYSFYARI